MAEIAIRIILSSKFIDLSSHRSAHLYINKVGKTPHFFTNHHPQFHTHSVTRLPEGSLKITSMILGVIGQLSEDEAGLLRHGDELLEGDPHVDAAPAGRGELPVVRQDDDLVLVLCLHVHQLGQQSL